MTPQMFLRIAIDPALTLLPEDMGGDRARAMVVSIGLQESNLEHRRQRGGPARGFTQFEKAGIFGVLNHPASMTRIRGAMLKMAYHQESWTSDRLLAAVEHNDVLCAAMARCLLWTLPAPLPERDDADTGWRQYLEAWRPGRPRPESWAGNFSAAWAAIEADFTVGGLG